MAKSRKSKVKLNPNDLNWSNGSLRHRFEGLKIYLKDGEFDIVIKPDKKHSRSPNPRGRTDCHQPRSFDSRGEEAWVLEHMPTGVEAHGKIEGHYSKKERTAMRQRLYEELLPVLEVRVAKHLRIPGQ